jgi:hypothetical protein
MGLEVCGRDGSASGEPLVNLCVCVCVSLGYGPLIREYVFFLESKLAFHRNHPEFNGREAGSLLTMAY